MLGWFSPFTSIHPNTTSSCCAKHDCGTPIPNSALSVDSNSKQKPLDKTLHDYIKNFLGIEFMSDPTILYNNKFTELMSNNANSNLVLVVFQHKNKAFAALVDTCSPPNLAEVIKNLTDNVSFNGTPPQVSENGPAIYVASLGLVINANYSVSDAKKACFDNPQSGNMQQPTNMFPTSDKNTAIITDVMTIEEPLDFRSSSSTESSPIPARPFTFNPCSAPNSPLSQCKPPDDEVFCKDTNVHSI